MPDIRGTREFKGESHYRCVCGLRISIHEWRYGNMYRWMRGPCKASANARHEFTYIYPDGHPAIGPKRS